MCVRERKRETFKYQEIERERREGWRGADRECEKIKLKMIKITSKERNKERKK